MIFPSFTFRLTKVASLVLFSTLTASSSFAGGFSLFGEANGRNSGDFAAGAAADAEDASTLFYNPAGLAYLKGKQLVFGGTIVKAKSTLGEGAYTNLDTTGTTSSNESIAGLSSNQTALLPTFYYSNSVSEHLTLGLGMYVPFGLSTDWGENSNANYAATLSKLEVINLSPALGVKLNDKLSFGFAFDVQMASVDFNSMGGFVNTPWNDSLSTNHGNSVGFGGHLGFLYQYNQSTRVGLNYQSPVWHQFYGKSTLTGPLSGSLSGTVSSDALYSSPISMPAQITVSGIHQLNSKLTLNSTLAFTQWSVFENIALHNVVGAIGEPMNVVVSENFRNTWRIAAGMKYQYSDKIKVRMGLGFDQSPANNQDRNLRLPDADRIALAAGAHYQVTSSLGFDFGWTHLFVQNTTVDNNTISADNTVYVNAAVKTSVDLLGAQVTWKIS